MIDFDNYITLNRFQPCPLSIALKWKISLLFLFPFFLQGFSQTDTLLTKPIEEDMLEDAAESTLTEDVSDNTILEGLESFKDNKLDLNVADASALSELVFLSPMQIEDILGYRSDLGLFLSVYELQAVPSLDLTTIKQMLPFVTVGNSQTFSNSLKKLITTKGESMVITRWSAILEKAAGYSESQSNYYLGDKNRYYLRYRYSVGRNFSAGFTAEKDAGEPFFSSRNEYGFDYYSFHLFLRQQVQFGIKTILIGDFETNFGQGLIQFQGFSTGKSSLTTSVKKVAPVFKAHTSVNEIDFYRGIASSFKLTPNLTFNGFISRIKRDANLIAPIDSLSIDDFPEVSSLQRSGLHRTPGELMDKNSTLQTSFGGSIEFSHKHFQFSLNGIHHSFSKPLNPTYALYNKFYFRGLSLSNLSTSYSWTHKNIHIFGEIASSEFNSIATINGLLVSLGRGIETAFVFRNYPKDFMSLSRNGFGESRTPNNEEGLYFGANIQLSRRWKLNIYRDIWKNDWPRFGNDAPSSGNEFFGRLSYEQRNNLLVYFQIKSEQKDVNVQSELHSSPTLPRNTFQTRLHAAVSVSEPLELRTRVDWGRVTISSEKFTGFSIYQDIIYRKLGSPWSFSGRYAIFDTEDYSIRFYHYENDVLYSFSIPAYYDTGIRYYLKLRYKIRRGPAVELRYARTTYPGVESIGSYLDQIKGDRKTEVKCQLYWKF